MRAMVCVWCLLASCAPSDPVSPARSDRAVLPSGMPSPAEPSPTEAPPQPAPPASPSQAFSAAIAPVAGDRMTNSWRAGCPVTPGELRLVSLDFWGFDDRPHRGELVIHHEQAATIVSVMEKLYNQRFPIERMELVDRYGGDDEKSMEANNTSAFNCRRIAGKPDAWSQHAFGNAIDINPVQNPYVGAAGKVSPAAGGKYAFRSRQARGMIHPGGPVVRAFAAAGWEWGGSWQGPKDYQHFSENGK